MLEGFVHQTDVRICDCCLFAWISLTALSWTYLIALLYHYFNKQLYRVAQKKDTETVKFRFGINSIKIP